MKKEIDAYRSSTPTNYRSISQLDGTEKKKRRKIISIRRFKISSDGTRRLISVQTGISPSKTKQTEPNDSCVVEPFYVPVNSRIKNKDSKNFWDDGLDEPYAKKSLNNSTLNGSG